MPFIIGFQSKRDAFDRWAGHGHMAEPCLLINLIGSRGLMILLMGIAAATGIGIGDAVIIKQKAITVIKRHVQNVENEVVRYYNAINQFINQLNDSACLAQSRVGKDEADILRAQIEAASDPQLQKEVLELIAAYHVNVEYAFAQVCDRYIDLFSHMDDVVIRSRMADIKDMRNQLLSILMNIPKVGLEHLPEKAVLIADDLTPSQVISIDPNKIHGIATQTGTEFSHVSIIARALQIPTVVSLNSLLDKVKPGDKIVVDGKNGRVHVNPDLREVRRYERQRKIYIRRSLSMEQYKNLSDITLDGQSISLAANISLPQEALKVREYNTSGVGLYRTEIIFLDRLTPPSEEEQCHHYKHMLLSMDGSLVTARTLDIGGDKQLSYLGIREERNPYLGCRGIRFSLEREDLFKTQIRALLRASVYGRLQIMLPMVSVFDELHKAKLLIEEVKYGLTQQKIPFAPYIPLGVMIETPSAALCAKALAKEADFFSIGTNDLTQYTLAVDRGNERVADLYSALHPSVLQLVKLSIDAARHENIPITACGESARDPYFISFLLGAGIDGISVEPGSLMFVRKQIINTDISYWSRQIPYILEMPTAGDVIAYMKKIESQKEGSKAI